MKKRRLTFADQKRMIRGEANSNLWAKALAASSIAKITKGRNCRVAYMIKAQSIDQFVAKGGGIVYPDYDRYEGLLSVRGPNGFRLHSHHSWLRDSIHWKRTS